MAKVANSTKGARTSDVSTLRAENPKTRERRLVLRPTVIEAAGWPIDTKLELIAESIEFGRIKLHLATIVVTGELNTKRTEIESGTAPEKDELLAAFDHKFRQVSWHPNSNNQLVLSSVVALHLGIPKSTSEDVYLEVVGTAIDVMSAQFMAQRQRELSEHLSINLST